MDRSPRWIVPLLGGSLIVAVVLLLTLLLRPATVPGPITAQAADTDPVGLNVVGEGVIKVKPDVAYVNLSVITTAQTAQEATAENATRMTKVMERLAALGIPNNDIRTVGLNIHPIVDYSSRDPNNNQRITGYRAQDSIIVTVPVNSAGSIFDEGIAAGANQSSSMSFGLRDDNPHRLKALESAVKSARQDADTLAAAMGLSIKSVRSVSIEYGGGKVEVHAQPAAGAPDARTAAGPPTPINPGDLTITARVRVVYNY